MRKWALVSVFEKRGIAAFCKQLTAAGYGILSTGGTAAHLQAAGVAVTQVEDYTGFPEMMGGRVKTLHPKVHGGILGIRSEADHAASMAEYGIDEIDLVVVNLYPFRETIARPGTTFAEAVEMIDIGGPSMLRAAAKNHPFCIPVVDPEDYEWIGGTLVQGETVGADQRRALAAKVFAVTAEYDRAIADYMTAVAGTEAPGTPGATKDEALASEWPSVYTVSFQHKQALRYGENPHQQAHFYVAQDASPATIAGAQQLHGKALSYNNIQDADAALNILRGLDDLQRPAFVAVKHMNPCGIGLADDLLQAFQRAYEGDPISIFGGIVAANRTIDTNLAERLADMFLEIIIAPDFTPEALAVLTRKKNVRVLTVDMKQPLWQPHDHVYRRVSGGLLVQAVDLAEPSDWRVVTDRQPTETEWSALRFAWRVVKFVKSNAIVLTTDNQTLGIGAGQMNRVGAAKIAIEQAASRAAGSVLASDAFFPMRDTVDTAAAAGIRAIVQPGGSIKDEESIQAANEHGIAMVFTGQRHFLH